MEPFDDYLNAIEEKEHRAVMAEVLAWVKNTFTDLGTKIAWKQPMFTDHGTFIIAFSAYKNHMAVAPERAGIEHFSAAIKQAGYHHTKMLMQMPWDKPVDYDLLKKMIAYNIEDKKDVGTFWRE
jgi:uncharacterized protein YdhG (YjbR/CyaY superfamily)